ncbi:unnamed protein product [Linum trigynum]|uniref:Uncharacterized protein n=1 Tax=Linum trigynum TaxID=586398 RepID=A0AAV2GAG7_9ROSI
MSTPAPGTDPLDCHLPDATQGFRRPVVATSSPNGKGEKETQQAKKRLRSLITNPLFGNETVMEDAAKDVDGERGTASPTPTSPGRKIPPS